MGARRDDAGGVVGLRATRSSTRSTRAAGRASSSATPTGASRSTRTASSSCSQIQEAGLNPAPLLKLLGVGGKALSARRRGAQGRGASCRRRRARRWPRAACCRASPAIKPPLPPSTPGHRAGRARRARPHDRRRGDDHARTCSTRAPPPSRSIKPAGFLGGSANHARGHLISRLLGGSGTDARNLATIYQNPVNTPVMRGFEAAGGQRRPRRADGQATRSSRSTGAASWSRGPLRCGRPAAAASTSTSPSSTSVAVSALDELTSLVPPPETPPAPRGGATLGAPGRLPGAGRALRPRPLAGLRS